MGILASGYHVTTNVRAAEIAAAVTSRILIVSPSSIAKGQNERRPRSGRHRGTQAPKSPSLHLIRTVPSTPEFHRVPVLPVRYPRRTSRVITADRESPHAHRVKLTLPRKA